MSRQPYLAMLHRWSLYSLGPTLPTKNLSSGLTCDTGTDLMQRNTTTWWKAGRLVTYWESNWWVDLVLNIKLVFLDCVIVPYIYIHDNKEDGWEGNRSSFKEFHESGWEVECFNGAKEEYKENGQNKSGASLMLFTCYVYNVFFI